MMKLAYVVPSYSRPEAILLLIDNISRQTVNKYMTKTKLVISIDRTDPELERYKSFIEQFRKILDYQRNNLELKLLINETKGLVAAKNNAVRSTDTELIMMIDDDLYMNEDYTEKLVNDIEVDETIGAVSGHIVSSVPAISHTQESSFIDEIPSTKSKLQTLRIQSSDGEWRSVFGKKEQVMDWSRVLDKISLDTRYEMDYFVNSYLFRRSAFDKIGGYNLELNSKTSAHEEVDFTYRIGMAGYKLLFDPFARMWHITLKKGGIYKGKDFASSKSILENEYHESLPKFLRSVSTKR